MILINLLPHREAARRRTQQAFQAVMIGCVALGLVLAAIVHGWFDAKTQAQGERNAYLRQQIAALDGQIAEIATLEQEINALHERQKAVEDLQAGRNLPVHMLNELVSRLPEGMFLTAMKQSGANIELHGSAQSNERVSELLKALSLKPTWFSAVDLKQIESASVDIGGAAGKRKIANFVITFKLTRPESAERVDATQAAAAALMGTPGTHFPVVEHRNQP